MSMPWYDYPVDRPGTSYGQIAEPLNPSYLKPDVNIAVPPGTPITALLPGTITDVSNRGGGSGGLSITERLTTALNSLAKYISYNYLGGANAYKGEQVSAGQQIGTAGSPTGINFALALGSDPVWGGPGFAQNAKGNPLLDPTSLIQQAAGGQQLTGQNCTQCDAYTTFVCNQLASTPTTQWAYGKLGIPDKAGCDACLQCAQNAATQAISNAAGIDPNQSAAFGQIGHILQNFTTPDFWMRVGIGLAAVILVLWGLHTFVANTGAAHKAEDISQKAPAPPQLSDLAKAMNQQKQQPTQSGQQEQEPSNSASEEPGTVEAGAGSGATEAAEVVAV